MSKRRFTQHLGALLLVASLATACSTTTEIGADDPGGVTPEPSAAPEAASPEAEAAGPEAGAPLAPPDPDAPREVPELVLPRSAPGTNAAYDELLADLDRFLTDEQRTAGVPWPDLRNPDPIEVYRSSARFQQWMAETNTAPSLVEAYTAPNSPERGWDVSMFAEMELFDVLSTPNVPPYEMDVRGVVHPAATDITDALLAQVPPGSAAVVYWDSVGASDLVTPDGNVLRRDEGWTDLGPWVAIMAPTDVGWQVWWDELTTIPPVGLDDDRGLPQTSEDRVDL